MKNGETSLLGKGGMAHAMFFKNCMTEGPGFPGKELQMLLGRQQQANKRF